MEGGPRLGCACEGTQGGTPRWRWKKPPLEQQNPHSWAETGKNRPGASASRTGTRDGTLPESACVSKGQTPKSIRTGSTSYGSDLHTRVSPFLRHPFDQFPGRRFTEGPALTWVIAQGQVVFTNGHAPENCVKRRPDAGTAFHQLFLPGGQAPVAERNNRPEHGPSEQTGASDQDPTLHGPKDGNGCLYMFSSKTRKRQRTITIAREPGCEPRSPAASKGRGRRAGGSSKGHYSLES